MIPFALAIDMNSDYGTWTSSVSAELGDCAVLNLGHRSSVSTQYAETLGTIKRFQSVSTSSLRLTNINSSWAYRPNVIYIGNHNLPSGSTIVMKAHANLATDPVLYTVNIPWHDKNIFYFQDRAADFSVFAKCFTFDITVPTAQAIKIGRLVLSEALQLEPQNDILSDFTYGYKHYKTETATESRSRVCNTHARVKHKSISFQINTLTQRELNDRLQILVKKGGINTPVIIIPFLKEPQRFPIYGVLTDLPSYEQNFYDLVTYSLTIEGIE